jgi:phosphoglycolate phosphatase-like HAD superfamily hydrolase
MKLIIFDIDGTLTDTKKVDDICFIDAFDKTFGIDISSMDWSEFTTVTDWGITRDIVFKEQKKELSKADHELMKTNFFEKLIQEKKTNPNLFREVAGAIDFFNLIKNSPKYEVGIATGCWEQSGVFKLNAIGIDASGIAYSNSDRFITRENIVLHTIEQAEENSQQKFSEIVYFGDGIWDYKTCENLGIRFIGIDILKDGKLKDIGTNVVFENFLDNKTILEVVNA